tara:strand:- start:2735 stop:3403 length:669 start_codon:yes stop_codon:yes gene_type:complete
MSNLNPYYDNNDIHEIGIDEAGRGPLFGRLYTSAVILPKDNTFKHELMCDSKKVKSFKKLKELSEYIKHNSIAWSIDYLDNNTIDKINIRQSVLTCMHNSAKNVLSKLNLPKATLLVDGNDFKPFTHYYNDEIIPLDYYCIKSGDNTYSSIAAASILAKYERDMYIIGLCDKYPILDEYYALRSNKGYGTKKHIEGIEKYGITDMHRKTYNICKDKFTFNLL